MRAPLSSGPAAARALLAAALVFAGGVPVGATEAIAEPIRDWDFRVLLDGKPIGTHHFKVGTPGELREVVSEASVSVSFFGITAYRYRHRAAERWHGGCLSTLASDTDDDGKPSRVRLDWRGEAVAVSSASAASQPLQGCVMSFAYWNPAIRTQAQLLNAQTGQLESVCIQRLPAGSIDVHGRAVAANGFRITGPAHPIDVWYSAEGDWIGLDSMVGDGKALSYRLP